MKTLEKIISYGKNIARVSALAAAVYFSPISQEANAQKNISKSSVQEVQFGGPGFKPVSGDYDGDGKTDPVVYNQSTGEWKVLLSSANYNLVSGNFGGPGFQPVSGDYDGDGKTDLVIYNQPIGEWNVLSSSANYNLVSGNFGGANWTPISGDFDGDKISDLAVYNQTTGVWDFLLSNRTLETILYDNFNGSVVDANIWHIPTWVSSSDGTFIGRTQFRCTQNSPLPQVSNDNAIISVESYNPTGYSFYGTDLIGNQSFTLDKGFEITVRAKMNNSTPGIVGGIFLYALKPGSDTIHDEIDFELLTNLPNNPHTNIYGNEPLGTGHPQLVSYASGSITDYHTYKIRWLPNKVSWFLDNNIVRETTNNVPAGPMNFHLNLWVPDSSWTQAYSSSIQPTSSANLNQIYSMSIDSVTISALK